MEPWGAPKIIGCLPDENSPISGLLLSADLSEIVNVQLLDMSSAFDTVDRNIQLKRLNLVVEICDTTLDWFAS